MTKTNVQNPLLQKLLGASTTKRASTVDKSKYLNAKDFIPTSIPALNIAYSGRLDGGLTPGLTVIAGPSKHFKSLFMLLSMKAYLDKYPDAIAYLYDSEFGLPRTYFESVGIDMTRVVHVAITNIEELKMDISKVLEAIERDDKVFMAIDSVGNLASKKEVDDALDGKSVADMTRAKQLKSVFRIATPHLTIKDIPLVVVNHTYKEQSLFPKDIVSGGTGIYYSADNIWIIGRRQEKNGKELSGFSFVVNIEKSRYVIEKSKIFIKVDFKTGLYKYSGLLDIALSGGFIVKTKPGWYAEQDPKKKVVLSDKSYREKDTGPLLEKLLHDKAFGEYVEETFQLAGGALISEETSGDDDED